MEFSFCEVLVHKAGSTLIRDVAMDQHHLVLLKFRYLNIHTHKDGQTPRSGDVF